jgi:pseudouridine kinase
VVGGINLDIQASSYAAFRAGDSNPGTVTMLPGGVGRNIAENLARLGCETELLTAFGDDAASETLRESCAGLGIGISGSLFLGGTASSLYVCILGPEGRLAGAVAAMDAFARLDPAFLDTRRALLDSASAIVVDANIPGESIAWLAARYGRSAGELSRGRPLLFLDPVSVAKARRAAECIGAFDCAKPNRAEAFALAGLDFDEDAPGEPSSLLPPLARVLHERGLGELYVSLGSEGFFYSDGAVSGLVRADRSPGRGASTFPPLVNVSGAGDAACAALVWAHVRGLDLRGRASAALAAAAFCASSIRTVHPDLSGTAILNIAQGVIHEPVL